MHVAASHVPKFDVVSAAAQLATDSRNVSHLKIRIESPFPKLQFVISIHVGFVHICETDFLPNSEKMRLFLHCVQEQHGAPGQCATNKNRVSKEYT